MNKTKTLIFLVVVFNVGHAKTLLEYQDAFEASNKVKLNYTLQYGSLLGNKIGLCDRKTGTVTIDAASWKNESESGKEKIINRELANCALDNEDDK